MINVQTHFYTSRIPKRTCGSVRDPITKPSNVYQCVEEDEQDCYDFKSKYNFS